MKKLFYPALATVILVSSAFMSVTAVDWKIADGYSIKFTSDDPSGIFKEFTGSINFDESDLANAKFDLKIPVSSISTGNGMQNKKAMTEEWFDQAKYPNITYTSTSVVKADKGYTIIGNLKLKGTTKTYKIPVDFKKTGETGKFTGSFKVNRLDFKIGKPGGGVPDYMKIDFSVPVKK